MSSVCILSSILVISKYWGELQLEALKMNLLLSTVPAFLSVNLGVLDEGDREGVITTSALSLGADVKAADNYAVRLASKNGYLEIVEYLVSLGADVKAVDNYEVQLVSKNGAV